MGSVIQKNCEKSSESKLPLSQLKLPNNCAKVFLFLFLFLDLKALPSTVESGAHGV